MRVRRRSGAQRRRASRLRAQSPETSCLFILGTGRCGSTLLARLLARHPGVAFASQVDETPGASESSEAYALLAREVSPILVAPCRDLVAADVTPPIDSFETARTLVLADCWLDVRYEDLVSTPHAVLGQILEFAGLELGALGATLDSIPMASDRLLAFRHELRPGNAAFLAESPADHLRCWGYAP